MFNRLYRNNMITQEYKNPKGAYYKNGSAVEALNYQKDLEKKLNQAEAEEKFR